MAHIEQTEFVKFVQRLLPAYFDRRRVLEIGSLDVNGSIRGLFQNCDYTGLDLMPGPGVDIVSAGQDYSDPDASFDVVLSCETMEHNPFWRQTFLNMIRLCRPAGLVLMTCATAGRAEHGTARCDPGASPPTVAAGWNYYRNLRAGDFRLASDLRASFKYYTFSCNHLSSDLYFVGIRHGTRDGPVPFEMRRAVRMIRAHYACHNIMHFRALRTMLMLRMLGERRHRQIKNLWTRMRRVRSLPQEVSRPVRR